MCGMEKRRWGEGGFLIEVGSGDVCTPNSGLPPPTPPHGLLAADALAPPTLSTVRREVKPASFGLSVCVLHSRNVQTEYAVCCNPSVLGVV